MELHPGLNLEVKYDSVTLATLPGYAADTDLRFFEWTGGAGVWTDIEFSQNTVDDDLILGQTKRHS